MVKIQSLASAQAKRAYAEAAAYGVARRKKLMDFAAYAADGVALIVKPDQEYVELRQYAGIRDSSGGVHMFRYKPGADPAADTPEDYKYLSADDVTEEFNETPVFLTRRLNGIFDMVVKEERAEIMFGRPRLFTRNIEKAERVKQGGDVILKPGGPKYFLHPNTMIIHYAGGNTEVMSFDDAYKNIGTKRHTGETIRLQLY